ncbi:MAG: hypothetical protein KC560_17090, partial [Myxococcales bacterium]|nr:hypothetical protein [Myxococcales bacterium]
ATTAYFLATGRRSREASLAFLRRVAAHPDATPSLGRPPGWRDAFRHSHEFSTHVMDRVCLWMGALDELDFAHTGADALRALEEASARGRGAIFLGSHYGSFDMLRMLADRFRVPVSVVMYTANAPVMQAVTDRLAPGVAMNVIAVAPGSPKATFEIRARLERGEVVAILADRAGPADAERTVDVDFLGAPVRLPRGPFEIALLLRCPLLVATARRVGDATYEVGVEPFYDGRAVPRAERERAVATLARAFAAHLERLCLEDPFQWFNFYDYWGDGGAGSPPRSKT